MVRCLIHLFDEWQDFRMAELNSLFKFHGLSPLSPEYISANKSNNYLFIDLPNSQVAKAIASRSSLINEILEVWESGETCEELIAKLHTFTPSQESLELMDEKHTWSFEVGTYCRSMTREEKDSCRQSFKFLDIKGSVSCKNPDMELILLLNLENHKTDDIVMNCPAVPSYLGRLIGRGGMRDELK